MTMWPGEALRNAGLGHQDPWALANRAQTQNDRLANAMHGPDTVSPSLRCELCDGNSYTTRHEHGAVMRICDTCHRAERVRGKWRSRTWWLWPIYILAGQWGRR